ncbi:hypothetical protein CEE55_17185 [Stenotrophomonas pavanii]|jgi:hypothetical protein|uniref:Uncharacterized protein n=1 Tax=Stenotrophomonas pavanii TaxID=487698 RepID=A0A246KVP1_9GAMM|nr:hypothetical protein [Stenotrophomonas pavanii]OWR29669.1 hypothetical protein CEE55_17125 [Stenotrophomonas pavanii]OWR29681.1 hypothetical protein CEE55_17185 [Stenotrophomonas pavanii]
MVDPLITFVLLVAVAAVSIGTARIVSWLLDRRDRAAAQRVKEAAIVAQARAELAATGWTVEDEAAFQALQSQQGKHLRALRPEFRRLFEEGAP